MQFRHRQLSGTAAKEALPENFTAEVHGKPDAAAAVTGTQETSPTRARRSIV
jgi:hypothetical protein